MDIHSDKSQQRIEEINPDDWEKVMQIDLNGTFNVTRLAIPNLKKSALQAGIYN